MTSMLNLFFDRPKIHSTSFLNVDYFASEESMLLLLRKRYTLHEHILGGIYKIYEIVSHVVVIPINSEGHFRSVPFYDINKQ
jgi:hypothetical protein